jgi:hypothetical protein
MIALKRNHMFREGSKNTMRIFSHHSNSTRQFTNDDAASNMPRPLLSKQDKLTVITCLLILSAASYSVIDSQASETPVQSANATSLMPKEGPTTLPTESVGPAARVSSTSTVAANSGEPSTPSSTTGRSLQSSGNFQVSVNGQDITVPPNGSMSQYVPVADGSGQTHISVTNIHSSDGTSHTHSFSSTSSVSSSTNLDVNSEHGSP